MYVQVKASWHCATCDVDRAVEISPEIKSPTGEGKYTAYYKYSKTPLIAQGCFYEGYSLPADHMPGGMMPACLNRLPTIADPELTDSGATEYPVVRWVGSVA